MPAALVNILRPLVIALLQTGAFIAAEKLIMLLIDKIQAHYRDVEGLSAEDAELASQNIFVQILVYTGVTFALIKGRVPVRIADRMGLKTKGLAVRKLSPAGEVKLKGKTTLPAGSAKPGTGKVVATPELIETVVADVAIKKGVNVGVVRGLMKQVNSNLGVIALWYLAIINTIDFANWQGAYQKTFQKIFTKLGFPPDKPMPKARTLSPETWTRIHSTIEELNPTSIYFPISEVTKPYNLENLADMIDQVAAMIVKDGEQPTFKNVIGYALPLIDISGVVAVKGTSTQSSSNGGTNATSTPTVKVFTGVVSQGVVGGGLTFQARQDDLIENIDELLAAAANNLAPYLASLPSKVVYEVKVVASITTANGFKQTGTTQRIQTGTTKGGTPTYKTVTNKFATLILYILTDKGTRTKLTTVVLGPVDSARFIVTQNDLRTLEGSLPKIVTTSSPTDVLNFYGTSVSDTGQTSNIPAGWDLQTYNDFKTANPTTEPNAEDIARMASIKKNDTGFKFWSFTVNGEEYIEILPWLGNIPTGYTEMTKDIYLAKEKALITANPTRWIPFFNSIRKNNPTVFTTGISGYIIQDNIPYYVGDPNVPETVPNVNQGAGNSSKPGSDAKTLSEYYSKVGQTLPTLDKRGNLYENLGLGQKSYYVGTAEQNTKLLNAILSAPSIPTEMYELNRTSS